MKSVRSSAAFAALVMASVAASTPVRAAGLYSQNFDTDDSANWTVRKLGTASGANFNFDYSTYGISPAPNSGGTTKGVKLEANISPLGSALSLGGLSVSPNGQSFTGNYVFHVDAWFNFLGPAPAGGSGTTQFAGLGVGTAGTAVQNANNTPDSVYFGTTLDGQSSVDFRTYSSAAPTGYISGSPVFAASAVASAIDTRQNTHPYYSNFGGITIPTSQKNIYSTQTGATAAGVIAFGWHDFAIQKIGNTATWYIDGKRISTVDLTTVTLGGSNIFLNMFDTNGTQAVDPNRLNFALYDNVRVLSLPISLAATTATPDFTVSGTGAGSYSVSTYAIPAGEEVAGSTIIGFSPNNPYTNILIALDFTDPLTSDQITALSDIVGFSTTVNPAFGAGYDAQVTLAVSSSGAYDFSYDFTSIPGLSLASIAVVPEPAALGLLAPGALALLARRRRA